MGVTTWPDAYQQKKKTAAQAIGMIKSGQRVFIGTACGEPQTLVRELVAQSDHFTDLEIVRLMSLESAPLTMIADRTDSTAIDVRSFYLGSAKPKLLADNRRFITPINISRVPRLFLTRQLPIQVALIQVSEPDDFGWMSLGISVDVTMAAAKSADLVIAQINPKMPRVLGRSFIQVEDVDIIVEQEEPLLTIGDPPEVVSALRIAKMVAGLIEDGSTLQVSLGSSTQALLTALGEKNDLGIHTQFLSDGIMNLTARGVITNRKKGFIDGKLVASGAIGTQDLYRFLHNNPAIEFHPSELVNDPNIIARHTQMISLNVAMAMDLTGQAAADALPYNHFCGVSGIMDFIRGSQTSPNGKSIIMLPSTTLDGKASRIVPFLDNIAVVIPRGDIEYVATEYGVVNLFGKSIQERAMALISIAHPDFRDVLLDQAKEAGLLGRGSTLGRSQSGVYPFQLETTLERDGKKVLVRPAKPSDARRIQEHFYTLDPEDVIHRFFHERTTFLKKEMQEVIQVDYVEDLTMVAVVGRAGLEEVVSLGCYFLNPKTNMAEAAFSTSKKWQGQGLSTAIIRKLAEAAKANGIKGLVAYTEPTNQGMIKLFHKLPYKVTTTKDEDFLALSCDFSEPLQ